MGLGKTLMTISLIWTLLKQNPVKKGPTVTNVLVVCPVTLINNWVNEFKKWLGPNKVGILTLNGNNATDRSNIMNFGKLNVYQVLIMNYEKIGTYFEELSGVSFDLMICDEGHRLKSSTNKVLNYLSNLRIPKRILLTGTPIQNDLIEFFTIINFVNPGVLGEFKLFQKEYINPIVKSREVNCYDPALKKKGEELSKELIRMTQKFILRRTQSILTKYLTKKTDLIIFVPPTQLQIKLFKFILNLPSFLQQIDSNNLAFSLINVFKKICNSPSLLANDSYFKSIEQSGSFQLTTSSGKINILIPLLLEITSLKEKVVLISNYTKTLNLLELILKKLNISFIRLDGSTPNNMRSKLVNSFNKTDSINVFLLSSKAGGMGINLVGASRLILFDNDWNPAIDLQSMSRIHRDGQQKHCFIYRLMTTGCIDEKIFQRQLMKNNLSSTFLDNEAKMNDNVFDDYEMKRLFEIDYATKCNTHDLLECTCKGEGADVVEDMDITLNDEEIDDSSDDEDVPTTQSWTSARKLMESINDNDDTLKATKKVQMKKALSDYVHFDPNVAEPTVLEDAAVVNILNNKPFKASKSFPMSFIFCKTTNNIVPETVSVEMK
jgi:DNA repair and recombination protein RAD54B